MSCVTLLALWVSHEPVGVAPLALIALVPLLVAIESAPPIAAGVNGFLVGAAYGEPFWSPLPLAVRDPLALLPGGTR